jgi:hypothetical protein
MGNGNRKKWFRNFLLYSALIKKLNKIVLIYQDIQKGAAVAKSYITNGLQIYD